MAAWPPHGWKQNHISFPERSSFQTGKVQLSSISNKVDCGHRDAPNGLWPFLRKRCTKCVLGKMDPANNQRTLLAGPPPNCWDDDRFQPPHRISYRSVCFSLSPFLLNLAQSGLFRDNLPQSASIWLNLDQNRNHFKIQQISSDLVVSYTNQITLHYQRILRSFQRTTL